MITTMTRNEPSASQFSMKRIVASAIGACLFGGALLAMMMMIVMGALGMGFGAP